MDLKNFAETYFKLEEKSLEIMKVYGLEHYDLDSIEIEEWKGKTTFTIKTSIYYSGYGNESEWLTFELEEMNNDIDYFKAKYEETIERARIAKELAEEKKKEEKRLQQEERDKAEYERLKLKFESES